MSTLISLAAIAWAAGVTVATMALATCLALALGIPLGRFGTATQFGRALVAASTGIRGALLPFLLVPVFVVATGTPRWLSIALVVGLGQAAAVARWIVRPNNDWSSSIAGGVALGVSRAAQLSRESIRRGAVPGSLALVVPQTIVLEALLERVGRPSSDVAMSWGALLARGSESLVLVSGLAIAVGMLFVEGLARRWLEARRGW